MAPGELTLHVVGAQHPNPKGKGNRQFEILVATPGEPVELRFEPKNKADPNAIAVYSVRGIQLGYLTAERAPYIGRILREVGDYAAIFQAPTRFGALIRAAFDGNIPSLPPAHNDDESQADDDSGFYPDFIPDDD